MSKITIDNRSSISLNHSKDQQQSIKKRINTDESNSIIPKKLKRSIDVTIHWKKIQSIFKSNHPKTYECKSKNDYLILTDPLGDRSRFIISKSSYYWLNESIRLMQHHIDYGTTYNSALIGEIIEIERHLKALKLNAEKNGVEKTYFYRAEALLNFIRLCCTIFENPLEKYQRRLSDLFNLCANGWLHMFDIMLPVSIVRIEKSFVFDDDYGDFENDSILRYFKKDDQQKIKKINDELPNLRQILYSILLVIEKLNKFNLINKMYIERFEMIYEIWLLIDNELNSRVNSQLNLTKKKIPHKSTEKISWNFIDECYKYEKIFGTFTNNHTN